jgi:hypothetical protein
VSGNTGLQAASIVAMKIIVREWENKERKIHGSKSQATFICVIHLYSYIHYTPKNPKTGPYPEASISTPNIKNQDFFYHGQARKVTYDKPGNSGFPQDTTDTTNLENKLPLISSTGQSDLDTVFDVKAHPKQYAQHPDSRPITILISLKWWGGMKNPENAK